MGWINDIQMDLELIDTFDYKKEAHMYKLVSVLNFTPRLPSSSITEREWGIIVSSGSHSPNNSTPSSLP